MTTFCTHRRGSASSYWPPDEALAVSDVKLFRVQTDSSSGLTYHTGSTSTRHVLPDNYGTVKSDEYSACGKIRKR